MDDYIDVFEMQRGERDGADIRGGAEQPSVLTIDNCHPLRLESLDKVRDLLTKYVELEVQKDHIKLFEAHLLHRTDSWWIEVGEVGLIYLTDIKPTFTATLNFIFWDKKLGKDRRELVKEVVKEGFSAFKLNRVQATCPEKNGPMLIALKKIGMQQEGCLRGAFREGAADQDLYIFGLLKGEVDKWAVTTTSSAHLT